MTWLYIGAAVVAAASAVYAGEQQEKQMKAVAKQNEADADAAQGMANVQAEKIRKETRRSQSTAVAALAASGVDVTTGTAEQIQADIGERGEEDALTAILNGKYQSGSLRGQANLNRFAGDQAETAGYINAGSSLLSSVSASSRGWKGNTQSTWGMGNRSN